MLQAWWSGWRSPARSGDLGEQLAAEWLHCQRGFRIVARNWRNPRDRRQEIDLVCRDGEVLVFVEVKTRAPEARVPGYYAVNGRKKRVLLRAVRAYLTRLTHKPAMVRFDVVEVSLAGGPAPRRAATARAVDVWHFEAVPLFPKGLRT